MKRWIFKLVVLLLLGAVVNVGVAWGCKWGASHKIRTTHRPTEDDTRWWDAHVPEDFPSVSPWVVHETHTFGFSGTVMFERMAPQTYSPTTVVRIRAGWPVRALEGSIWIDPTREPVRRIDRHLMKVLDESVPFYPLLSGFAINTIFYAAILWLMTLGPFALRRHLRRKRGQCIKCGYDLRGDFSAGCPECGWRREEKVEA